jgi:hypothetical protein
MGIYRTPGLASAAVRSFHDVARDRVDAREIIIERALRDHPFGDLIGSRSS